MQKISVSNIAWPREHDAAALSLAADLGFSGIEIAPGKTFSGWDGEALREARAYRDHLTERGLAIPALQAILFGVDGCELFASKQTRAKLARHLEKVAKLAGILGAHACVYGAPKQRDPGDLNAAAAFDIAARFFDRIGSVFESEGSCLAFEANAPVYGCRFITRTEEAIELVRFVERPGLRLQLDSGTIFINQEPIDVVSHATAWACHFHASEPQLAAVGTSGVDHIGVGAALTAAGYSGWRSVEMKATSEWPTDLRRAAGVMRRVYS